MENFTSADIKGLIQSTQLEKMSKILKSESGENISIEISEGDIIEELKSYVKGMTN
jgi:hypothetical protein